MTSIARQVADAVTGHTRVVIAVLVLVTAVVGAGALLVDEQTGLEQFLGDSEATNASTFVQEKFATAGAQNQTTVQVIRRGENGEDVFTRAEFIKSLEFQQEIKSHPEIGPTLAESGEPPEGADPTLAAQSGNEIIGIGNVLALYELNRTVPTTDLNQTGSFNFSSLSGTENISEVTFADLGIDGFDDLPAGIGGNGTDPFAALKGIDNLSEFEAEFGGEIGAIPLGRVRPSAVGFQGVETLPPADCLVAFGRTGGGLTPPLSCQIWALEEMNQTEFENAAAAALGEDGELDALALLPKSYEAGSTTATAHAMLVIQQTEGGSLGAAEGYSENVTAAQNALRQLGEQRDGEYLVFGLAMVTDEIDQSLGDSLTLISPIALLFVILVLSIAYRDLIDILLGVAGILLVLLWTFGFMGWLGIAFNQLMIAVPVLLIGLSIDFAIHVVMRYRERRAQRETLRRAMAVGLAGVGVALVWVTATTAIGFLSNLISAIRPLQQFGIVSAFGVIAALIVFGGLIPAVKIEVDKLLENRGIDRQKPAFGTGESRLSGALTVGARAARRAPVVVVVLVLLLSAAGAYGASQVDTSFQEEDFLADSPPEWTSQLPGSMAPGEYHVKDALGFIKANYQQVSRQGELLVRGNVTDDEALEWMTAVRENASKYDTVYVLPNGQRDVRTPLTEMRRTARANDSFARSFENASTDGVPRENVSALYDEMLTRNPAASEVIYRTESGEYEAARIQIGVAGNASAQEAAADIRALSADLEAASDGQLTVVATGDPVIYDEVEQSLFETVIQSLLITLVAVFLFLAAAYRLTGSHASLGVVTLLPVLLSVTWILGTMQVLGISFNALTGTITSLTIGLGIDYNIHISDRFELELREQEHVWDALQTTVTGTGGALLGTAVTTIGGFGTLALAILPALRQFGIITGLTILYTFLASLLVLPALLVLWTRYLGPAEYFPETTASTDEQQAEPTED
jgi:predicted RND superfamily exporter protein